MSNDGMSLDDLYNHLNEEETHEEAPFNRKLENVSDEELIRILRMFFVGKKGILDVKKEDKELVFLVLKNHLEEASKGSPSHAWGYKITFKEVTPKDILTEKKSLINSYPSFGTIKNTLADAGMPPEMGAASIMHQIRQGKTQTQQQPPKKSIFEELLEDE